MQIWKVAVIGKAKGWVSKSQPKIQAIYSIFLFDCFFTHLNLTLNDYYHADLKMHVKLSPFLPSVPIQDVCFQRNRNES